MNTNFIEEGNAVATRLKRQAGTTLIEMMTTLGIFAFVVIGFTYVDLFGMRQDEMCESKLGASDSGRYAFNMMSLDFRSAKIYEIGNYSGTTFTTNNSGQAMTGNAVMLTLTTNLSDCVLYYFVSNTASLWRTSAVTPSSLIVDGLTNTMAFDSEDYTGTVQTNQTYKGVIHTSLQFAQYQYPLTKVGSNYLYNYYKMEFRYTPFVPDATMKTSPKVKKGSDSGFALLIMLTIAGCALLVAASTINRTATVSNLNYRTSQVSINQNAAEAAIEKVYAKMAFDFSSYGYGTVTNNTAAGVYQAMIPTNTESSYWNNFSFSDGQGHAGQTYVAYEYSYTGNLPSQYVVNGTTLSTAGAPVYRIISNVSAPNSLAPHLTNAVQEDVLLALVPLSTYAIFYNSLMEFSTCATMTINGRVHANGAIDVGGGGTLTFNGAITTTSTLSAPPNNGSSWASGSWNTVFNNNPNYTTNVPSVSLSMTASNAYQYISIPATNNASTYSGQQQLYNEAQTILLVSNNTVTFVIQAAPSAGDVPGQDTTPTILQTNNTPTALANLFPWLTTTNIFYDNRETKTNITTQIDVGKYAQWIATNHSVTSTLSASAGNYPTILYAANEMTNNAYQLPSIRLTNGAALPSNNGLGFSVVTPNPLYVWGNYNCTNSSYLGTSNSYLAEVPAALMSDALTLLSSNWNDSNSLHTAFSTSANPWNAAASDTVDAAILTGIVPSTGSTTANFSGGVHNLPRLLEDWSGCDLYLETSIINLFNSQKANSVFKQPGVDYEPPTRHFTFDPNFSNPAKQPPGIPCALVPIRFNWAAPPPNTISYNVTPTYD